MHAKVHYFGARESQHAKAITVTEIGKGLAKIRWGRARILRRFENDWRVAFVPLIIFGHGAFKET